MPVTVRNKRTTRFPANSIVVDTTSKSTEEWSRQLSPFYLGPVEIYPDDKPLIAKNVENAWQYCKVYSDHVVNDTITPEYWQWATRGWDSPAKRYPRGRGTAPLFSLWRGERLGYIEARKKIYCPLYAAAVVKTEAWQRLREIYEECCVSGRLLVLLDYDGRDAKKATYEEILNDPLHKCGHAFVLAMMLEGKRPWLA